MYCSFASIGHADIIWPIIIIISIANIGPSIEINSQFSRFPVFVDVMLLHDVSEERITYISVNSRHITLHPPADRNPQNL